MKGLREKRGGNRFRRVSKGAVVEREVCEGMSTDSPWNETRVEAIAARHRTNGQHGDRALTELWQRLQRFDV